MLGDIMKEAKSERTGLADLNQEVINLVREYAEAKAAEAEIKARLEALKERAISIRDEHGLDDLQGPHGVVKITSAAGPTTFDKNVAKRFLTEEQYKQCEKVGKPSIRVQFVPAADKAAE